MLDSMPSPHLRIMWKMQRGQVRSGRLAASTDLISISLAGRSNQGHAGRPPDNEPRMLLLPYVS